jgi:hypothetical protein
MLCRHCGRCIRFFNRRTCPGNFVGRGSQIPYIGGGTATRSHGWRNMGAHVAPGLTGWTVWCHSALGVLHGQWAGGAAAKVPVEVRGHLRNISLIEVLMRAM